MGHAAYRGGEDDDGEGQEAHDALVTSTRRALRQLLTTRSNSSTMRASSGGVVHFAPSHARSSSVAPRATAQPFQT